MPSTTIHFLSVACAALFVAYVALFATTIFFATLTTERSALVRELETRVASLETEYFSTIAQLSTIDLLSSGYVTPTAVEYVSRGKGPSVTRAGEQF
ncbi:hypothetical protein L0Y34_00790 [Candidatus Parcubacteria bacterium]|nr:hypothetical protein [Candidatus Parcubacteria bacterium]